MSDDELLAAAERWIEHKAAAAEPCGCYACTANWRVPLGGWGVTW